LRGLTAVNSSLRGNLPVLDCDFSETLKKCPMASLA
jgi:hypothetical protein